MEIKRLNPNNHDHICIIHNKAFSELIATLGLMFGYQRISSNDVKKWIEHENSTILVAYEDLNPLGYIYFQFENRKGKNTMVKQAVVVETMEGRGQSRIAVIPEKRRQGIATNFLKNMIRIAEDSNMDAIVVYSYNHNHIMNHILHKFGFSHEPIFYYSSFSEEKPFVHDSVLAEYDLSKDIDLEDNRVHENLLIREYHENDFPDIQQIFSECRPDMIEFLGKEDVGTFWLEQNWAAKTLVAEYCGEVVGCMEYNEVGIIGIPGVKNADQNRGIGTRLLIELLKNMKLNGFKKALANTGIILPNAIKLYQKLNFDTSRELWAWVKILK